MNVVPILRYEFHNYSYRLICVFYNANSKIYIYMLTFDPTFGFCRDYNNTNLAEGFGEHSQRFIKGLKRQNLI